MNKRWQYLTKQVTIGLVLLSLVAMSMARAERTRRNGVRTAEEDPRKEEMRREASESFPEVSGALKRILEKAAKNQRPDPAMIEQAAELLEKNKRNGWAYDEKQKAQFMLLQAWAGFYQDNLIDAVRWSMRACKTNEASQDAWNSQALFCMLVGKRPMLPRVEESKAPRRRPSNNGRGRNEDLASIASADKPYSEKGVLEFDLLGLRSEMLREQFGRLQFQTADDSEIEFAPGKDTLCMLFWQGDKDVSDANDMPDKQPNKQQPIDDFMGLEMGPSYGSQKTTLQAQRDYVRMIRGVCKENPEIKFVQMNTDRLYTSQNVAASAAKDPDVEEAGPLVFAADPASKAQRFIGVKADAPFMAIIDTEGKVKYAGTAGSFIPALILTELTGVEIDLEKQGQVAETPGMMGQTDPFLMEMMLRKEVLAEDAKSTKPTGDPNKPAVDPNSPKAGPNMPMKVTQPAPLQRAEKPVDFPTQSLEDEIRAEKLLQSAQMHIEESRKLRMKNPKQGIEDARKVLSEFPNTEYAQKARDLLRRVPDRWKNQYNITDEELGY